ncbi:MAG: transcription-repair coupling factor, partial [Gammaproteobacteria bacterium]
MQTINLLTPPPIDLQAGKSTWGQLHGCALALAVLNTATKLRSPLLIIVNDNQSAQQLENELRFFAHNQKSAPAILTFPDWETLPYDHFSPHQDIISQRLALLSQLTTLGSGIVIAASATLMQRLPPQDYLFSHSLQLELGQEIHLDNFRHRLSGSGYRIVDQVMEHGEFALRGAIIDLFPMGSTLPYRIDLFDDEIDSIRTFDPDNQRSLEKCNKINLLPAHEFPVNKDSINLFQENWRESFSGNPRQCPLYQQMSKGQTPAGIEYYLPLFFTETSSFFDYLPKNTLIMQTEALNKSAQHFWQEVSQRYEQLQHDVSKPILPPSDIFMTVDELFARCKTFAQVQLQQQTITNKSQAINFSSQSPTQLLIDRTAKQPLQGLADYLQQSTSRILFCAESIGRREALSELLHSINIQTSLCYSWDEFLNSDTKFALTHGSLEHGLSLTDPAIDIIVESQLFGPQVIQQRRRKQRTGDIDSLVRDLTELNVGTPVVHLEHGIGRYLGLQVLAVNESQEEFLILEYADDARIYVPVTDLHLVNRYTGVDSQQVALNKLGSDRWNKAKKKAMDKIIDVAAELLDIYAQREARIGMQCKPPDHHYQAFATAFPFEETPDQAQAIEHVITDLTNKKSTDRLICGDVGFGKTEVAMRAAFLVAHSGKQIALLVPTTLLADQHVKNFQDRFADFAFNIDVLSRFRTQKEQKAILQQLKAGNIDIIIGTHKLLQKDIEFKDLGLVIIDEEHRFGVRQKEKLKALRTNVDILSLTATPIPRTLNMAMARIRDISLITTPPAKRLAIKTFCQPKNKQIIREAVLREISRGGQVFYLHNKVETIQHATAELERLIPEAKIGFAHAQMRERELENIMSEFYHQRFNVLVCTTIIESGIDIPTA